MNTSGRTTFQLDVEIHGSNSRKPQLIKEGRFNILGYPVFAVAAFTVVSTLSIRMSSLTTCSPAFSMGNFFHSPSFIHCAAVGGLFQLLSRS